VKVSCRLVLASLDYQTSLDHQKGWLVLPTSLVLPPNTGNSRCLACGRGNYPPVIGGKKAISRAPAMAVLALTWALSIAARITLGLSKA
jgi:hypothetical protein